MTPRAVLQSRTSTDPAPLRKRGEDEGHGRASPAPAALHSLIAMGGAGGRRRAALDLQRTAGNHAVRRLVESLPEAPLVGPEGGAIPEGFVASLDREAGHGRPLPPELLQTMEEAFGADFHDVRLHDDAAARDLSLSFGARAFTTGNDIYLGPGASPSDRELLAHELTHVVQQSHAGSGNDVSAAGDASEVEAGNVAREVASGGAAPGVAAAGDGLQRLFGSMTDWLGGLTSGSVHRGRDPRATGGSYQEGADDNLRRQREWQEKRAPAREAGASAAWNALGAIPGVGTVTSGLSLIKNTGQYLYNKATGDEEMAQRRHSNMKLSALGMIPLYGNLLSQWGAMHDTEAMAKRERGATREEAPLYGDVYHQRQYPSPGPLPDPLAIPYEGPYVTN